MSAARTDTKLAAVRVIGRRELEARPGAPSAILREHEALLVAELARLAHMEGKRFDAWPELTLVAGEYRGHFDHLELRAEVTGRPA